LFGPSKREFKVVANPVTLILSIFPSSPTNRQMKHHMHLSQRDKYGQERWNGKREKDLVTSEGRNILA
jgi:hypothetical protein